MSGHTRDVLADGRASLTVTAPGFEGAADARVCLTGTVRRVPEARGAAARERYLARHPDAFWVDFGDFTFWQMEDLKAIRLVGGFARAGSVPPGVYAAAKPDPVAGACAAQVAHGGQGVRHGALERRGGGAAQGARRAGGAALRCARAPRPHAGPL